MDAVIGDAARFFDAGRMVSEAPWPETRASRLIRRRPLLVAAKALARDAQSALDDRSCHRQLEEHHAPHLVACRGIALESSLGVRSWAHLICIKLGSHGSR